MKLMVKMMPNFTFKFGAMGSTKTRDLLAVDHNFRVDCALDSFVVRPYVANRDGDNVIKSRDGGERVVDLIIGMYTFLYDEILERMPDIVLVDEAQFLTRENVKDLSRVVNELKIPVIAYGLKNDFVNEMFEGTKYLFIYADKFEQFKTACRLCTKTATMNVRTLNNKPIFFGVQVQMGGNESYFPTCSSCYARLKKESESCLKNN